MKITNFGLRVARTVDSTVKKFDLFAKNIMFTYEGDSAFSTFVGGATSLVIFAIVFVYGIFLLQDMVNRQNSNNSKSTAVVDLITQDEDYYPTDYGFAFGITVTDAYGRPLVLDPTYFTLHFAESTFKQIGGFYQPIFTDLGYKL